ncbi:MAG: hypothetical protein QNJ19_00535 [Woeseiaceae bacterium]|nr:hypothetical protein [Woeseiaceae bacterium]
MTISRNSNYLIVLAALAMLAACSGEAPTAASEEEKAAPAAAAAVEVDKPSQDHDDEHGHISHKDAKPFGPARIKHRIIGTPVVGQPLQINLDVRSSYPGAPVELSYRIPDTTALAFPANQLERVSLAAPQDDAAMTHQVSIVPQREGRLYLNVSAEVQTADGPQSTVMAIPIQVGSAPRELEENGTVIEDESGQLIRTLPASDK